MPEDLTPTEPTNDPSAAPTAASQPDPTPPWGSDDDFKPEKAWKLIQDLRSDKERLSARPVLTDEHQQQLNEYDRLVQASKTELERAQEERDRWQTEADRWRDSSVTSRIEALASLDFAFPADAVAKLDPKKYLDSGGVIDEAGIKRDLEAVLAERPNWRRVSDPVKARVPAPNPGQGSGGGTPVADPRQEFAAILQGQLNR